jgi:uncharacterized membrane protein YfcA
LNGKDNPSRGYLYRDIVGIVIWFVAAGVATACGVGGGGIYVPLGILLLAFAPKASSGLSQASIFGASLGGLVLNIRDKHPFTFKVQQLAKQDTSKSAAAAVNETATAEAAATECISSIPTTDHTPETTETCQYYTRPRIDYDMALFLAPLQMAGATLGVLIQTILPNWLYLMVSSVILGYTAYRTYKQWWDSRKKEQKAAAEAEEKAKTTQDQQDGSCTAPSKHPPTLNQEASTIDIDCSVTSSIADERKPPSTRTQKTDDHSNGDEEQQRQQPPKQVEEDDDKEDVEVIDDIHDLNKIDVETIARRDYLLERDTRQYPTDKLVVFFVLLAGFSVLTFLMGGKGIDSIVGITCQDPWYGVLVALQFLWTFGFALFYGLKLLRDTKEKQAVGYPFHPRDVVWDFALTRFYAAFTFFAGIVAGLVGIGGGMVLGPFMLVMGVDPRVCSATNASMIILTSSSVAILFVTSGLVPWQYAVCFFCTCFVGAYIGKRYIDGYVKKTGKASILIFLLGSIIAFATIAALVIVMTRLAEANWCFAGFNAFCKVSSDGQEVQCVPSAARLLQADFHTLMSPSST